MSLPEYTVEFLAANYPNRIDQSLLSGPYTPLHLAKLEIERLQTLAQHLRCCRQCGEMEVADCGEGRTLWEAAGLTL